MKNLYFLDEEEKNRILNIHESTTKKQYLSEANEKGGGGYVDPATDTPDAKIAREFYQSTAGMGTNEANMLIAIQSITSAVQFWKVNELVKNLPGNSGKLDIAGVINDEMGGDNLEDVKKIAVSLKSPAGITATYGEEDRKLNSGGTIKKFKENSFVITSKPVSTGNESTIPTVEQLQCIYYGMGSLSLGETQSKNYVYVTLTDGSLVMFNKKNQIQYQRKGQKTIYGKWSCKGNVFNAVRDDGLTWSKTQGGWIKSTNTQVVDPKVAYQERAKQVNLQTQTTTKQIQKLLGQPQTGNLDSLNVERMIDLLKQ